MDKLKQAKAQCLEDIKNALPEYSARLDRVDDRLMDYIADAISNQGEHANLYELLGIRKTLRLMSSYELMPKRVKMVIRAIEGVWDGDKHVKGGLKFDTPRGDQHVRLMPFQVWILFGIYGLNTQVSMEREYKEGETLLPTEFVKDGIVWDNRRLTSEAHIFITRKAGKTELGAAIDFVDVCFLGPVNGQALIACNSKAQATIAYKAVKNFASQIDPACLNKGGGKYFRVTADEMNWLPGQARKGEIKVMSAGGKTKDGLYASIVHADEHGSASYVKDHSDMESLVQVCVGSMGPRREKLLMHTTTAGNVNEGPYQIQLRAVEANLLNELQYPLLQSIQTDDDKWFAFLLRLDPWETDYELDQLNNPVLFRKVNRSIGVTVQPTWYRERLHDAATKGEDIKKEVLTKDFNIWQTGRVSAWISGDRIRPLQIDRRITDCRYEDGWNVFVGMDFSGGDDLFAITYLAVRLNPETGNKEFFADFDAWILEAALQDSPNRLLFEKWIDEGYLHMIPGEVFYNERAIDRLIETQQAGINIVLFGYDPAQSVDPINNLKAWLQSLGIDAKTVLSMVVPVRQHALAQNPSILELEDLIKAPEQFIHFSMNPMWPWLFTNALIEKKNDLRRLTKGKPQDKIDPVAALINSVYLFDLFNGNIQQ